MIDLPDYSDMELANDDRIVVVGKWRPASGGKGQVEVEVLSIVRGNCPYGTIKVFLKEVALEDDCVLGGALGRNEVNPSNQCLWFLDTDPDSSPEQRIFTVIHPRAIQPIETRPYFEAMWAANPESLVPSLLGQVSRVGTERVLRYINGGRNPWPFVRWFDGSWDGIPLKNERERVWNFIASSSHSRPLAVAVLAELAGPQSIQRLRTLLSDSDALVRAVAVGYLVRFDDVVSFSQFSAALMDAPGELVGWHLVDVIAEKGDSRLVPALISFLESYAPSGNDPTGTPAYWACKALKRLTGCVLPYDVAKAKQCLYRLESAATEIQREEIAKSISIESEPLTAKLIRQEMRPANASSGFDERWGFVDCIVTIEINNRSKEELVIPRGWVALELDDEMQQWCANPVRDFGDCPLVLPAGSQYPIALRVPAKDFFAMGGRTRKYRLCFLNADRVNGKKMWTGEVPLQIDVPFPDILSASKS